MKLVGTVQLLLLAGVAFSLIASLIASAVVPLLLRWTARWAPASRHRALVLVGVAPVGLTLVALLSVVLPSLLAVTWPAYDHCLVHDGHAHLCFVHPSNDVGGWAGWGVIAAALAWFALQLSLRVRSLARASGLLHELSRSAELDVERKTWVIPTAETFCLSVGFLRPRIVVSEGLLANAAGDELKAMLAHEDAHVRRRDALVRLLVGLTSLLLLPHPRRLLLATLELCSEQACDEEAAGRVGDRLRVAEAIIAMERRLTAASGFRDNPMVTAFGSSAVPQRIEALLLPPRHTSACLVLVAMFAGVVVLVLGLCEHLHHMTESVLAALY